MFGLVMLSLTFMAFMISVVVRDSVRKDVNSQLSEIRIQTEVIKRQTKALEDQARVTEGQNEGSKQDRAHLNNELDNTRASLKRLEEAVKKEVMKP